MYLELLLKNEIQVFFSSNDSKFGMLFIIDMYTFEKNSKMSFHLFHLNKVWERKYISKFDI
jgi:hypothetical protein